MRRWCKVAAALLAYGTLQACAAVAQTVQPGQIQLRDDQFRPYREYTTGRIRGGTHPNLLEIELNGRIDRQSGAVTTLFHVEFAYLGSRKRNYEAARNSRAQTLAFTKLGSSGRCSAGRTCPYSEVFTIEIPLTELRQVPSEGYQFKVFARQGPDAQLGMAKAQIMALLAKIDADRLTRTKSGQQNK